MDMHPSRCTIHAKEKPTHELYTTDQDSAIKFVCRTP